MLTLVDVLATPSPSPSPERLVEVDDAIRDLARAAEAAAEQDGLDRQTLSRALVGVLTAAAASQAMKAYPSLTRAELGAALADLAEEAVDWAMRRAPHRRNGRGGGAS
jgi:hypothetical protein